MRHRLFGWITGGAVAASALHLLMLSACGTAPYIVEELRSVRAWVIGSAEEGGEALATGKARWVPEDRCWVLEPILDEPSGEPSNQGHTTWRAIVWPKGTTIASDAPPTLRVAGRSVVDGAEIRGASAGTDAVPAGLDIPATCRPQGVVVINRLEG